MRILFNAGEGLDEADLNLQRELHLKHLNDFLMTRFARPGNSPIAQSSNLQLRPLRDAGLLIYTSGFNQVSVLGGTWISYDYTASDADAPVATIGYSAGELITGFVDAAVGQYRRDIVQARLVSQDEAPVSRDFKDAITGALSTTNLVKRSNIVVEFQRKPGTEYALQSDADDPANEVAADTGWTKIGSVLVDQNGLIGSLTGVSHWDWRYPWGFSSSLIGGEDFYWDYLFSTFRLTGDGVVENDIGAVLGTCPFLKNNIGQGSQYQQATNIRISRIEMSCDFAGAPAAADISIQSRLPTLGVTELYKDVGTTVGTADDTYGLWADGSGERPLWANGRTNPVGSGTPNQDKYILQVKMTTGNTNDKLRSLYFGGWGGF